MTTNEARARNKAEAAAAVVRQAAKDDRGYLSYRAIEWVPNRHWVVQVTGTDGSYTPVHQSGYGPRAADETAQIAEHLERLRLAGAA